MSFIDLILNLAGLLLWLRWRDKGQESSKPRISLLGTLRKTRLGRARIWFLLALLALLLIRPFFYWLLGSALNWTPQLPLGILVIPFRSDFLGRMFIFSLFSFLVVLTFFYLCLLLLSILDNKDSSNNPLKSLVHEHLGKVELLPVIFKCILPWLTMFVLWCGLNRVFVALKMFSPKKSLLLLMEQGAVISGGVYLAWEYLIIGILLLHLLNSYIYFGSWPIWALIDNLAKRILKPISWIPLRLGKLDFAPLVAIAVVFLAAKYGAHGLTWIYQKLPL